MTEPTERNTAYHEAGHAVANTILRRSFGYVTIVPSGDGILGHVRTGKILKSIRERLEWDGLSWTTSRERRWVEREIMTYYAAEAAEVALGNEHETLSSSDFDHIARWVLYSIPGEKERNAFVARLWERTLKLIKDPTNWVTIEELAAALLKRRRMSAQAVRKLIRETRGSIPTDPRLRERYERRAQLNRHEEEAEQDA